MRGRGEVDEEGGGRWMRREGEGEGEGGGG